jgi:hypothetical protein
VIVHRAICLFRCLDCERQFPLSTSGFDVIACTSCDGRRLELNDAVIIPPFTAQCGQGWGWDESLSPRELQDEVRNQPRHVWGVSARSDIGELERELQVPSLSFDFFEELPLAIRFVERLRLFGGYTAETDVALLTDYEARLRHTLFRQLREPGEGIEAVELSAAALAVLRDRAPLEHALLEYNFATYVFSLLREFGDHQVALNYRPGLRAEAIAMAEDALGFFGTGPGRTFRGADWQVAHLQCVLGDLLSLPVQRTEDLPPAVLPWLAEAMAAVGEHDTRVIEGLSDQDLRQAIAYLSDAIDSGRLSDAMQLSARNSRAIAILGLQERDRDRRLRRLAIEDMEAGIVHGGSGPERSLAWVNRGNLASLYLEEERLDDALSLLEQVCALGVVERRRAINLSLLHAQTVEFVEYFDTLALLYAKLDRPVDTLCALEWSRAATIRFHTMDGEEQAAVEHGRLQQRLQEAVAITMTMLGDTPLTPDVPPFAEELDVLRRRLEAALGHWWQAPAGTGFIGFALWENQVLAVVAGRSIRTHLWQADLKDLAASTVLTSAEQSAWREKRFRKLFAKANRALWLPLVGILAEQALTRVIVSAPGTLDTISFEAVAALAEADGAPGITDITYLPSFSVAGDLRASRRTAPGPSFRVLMVTYQGSDLPSAVEEATILRRIWGRNLTVLDTSSAAKREVLDCLDGDWHLIHFAGHGSFDRNDPWNSALHLTENPESDSQRVTATDLLNVRLRQSPVVVLSACSSVLTGASAINDAAGLTGAFLRTGAQGIVASRWPVYDETALAFMTSFHTALQCGTPAQAAVREAQKALKEQRGIEDWAAFSYVGIPA